jgi:hypothetical protein
MAERRGDKPEGADAPADEGELAAARKLRDALEDAGIPSEERDFARALAHAWAPVEIAPEELAALVSAAVDDADGRGRGDLAGALEGAAAETPEGELAVALRAAWSPAELDATAHDALLADVLGREATAKGDANGNAARRAPRGVVVRVAFGVSVSALALAASVLLFLTTRAETPAAPLAYARSTQPLFAEAFRPGEASARIDRIAMARGTDLRENRFARWGVKR